MHDELPQAIEELFDQIEQKHNLDYSDALDSTQKQSEYDYNRTLPERNAKELRRATLKAIMEDYNEESESYSGKIRLLLYIQDKLNAGGYYNLKSQLKKERRTILL